MELITVMQILLKSLENIDCTYRVIYDMRSGEAKVIVTGKCMPQQSSE